MIKATKKVTPKKSTPNSTLSAEKRTQIEALIKDVNRALRTEGKVVLGKDVGPIARVESSLLFVNHLTTGGYPVARYIELYGQDSGGKTLLALSAIRDFQEAGQAVLVASREEFDPRWALRQGVNPNDIVYVDTIVGDKALETSSTLMETGLFGLFVADSIQAFETKREAEGSIEDESYGNAGAPQMWGRMARRGWSMANRGIPTTWLGISQVRTAIGAYSPRGVPDPTPTQIRSIKHWKSISIETKAGKEEYLESSTGLKKLLRQEFSLKNKKNKTGIRGRTASYTYNYCDHDGRTRGFDLADDAFTMGRIYEAITNNGSHYHYKGKEFANGEEKAVAYLRKDEKLLQAIRNDVLERMRAEE